MERRTRVGRARRVSVDRLADQRVLERLQMQADLVLFFCFSERAH